MTKKDAVDLCRALLPVSICHTSVYGQSHTHMTKSSRPFLSCFCILYTVSKQKLGVAKGCLHYHRSPPRRRRRSRSHSRSPVRRYGSGRSYHRGRSRSRSYSPPRRRDRRTRRRSRYVPQRGGPQFLLQKGVGGRP